MLSIKTNLSSLITQSSMKSSTNALNQAVERMTTGYKINHAKDNAANYSIATNMTTKLNAYDVAADNVANGMDLVTTAMDTISMMQDKAARLSALSTQARNGTYGAQSLSAINAEANAIMSEIVRIYNTSQYNGVDLFNRTAYTIASHLPQAGASGFIDETALISMTAAGEGAGTTTEAPVAKAEYNGFIEDPKTYTDAEVAAMQSVSEAERSGGLHPTGTYKVSTVEDLEALAGQYTYSSTQVFVLANDIDLEQWCADHIADGGWNPIGTSSNSFKGTFDGNGHVIKNLKIDRETADNQGLFGYIGDGAEIKNVALENAIVAGQSDVGGLVGYSNSSISNSYATGSVSGQSHVGGLVGTSTSDPISNSYATGSVTGQGNYVGGLVGYSYSSISNSYATGSVSGEEFVGGLIGQANTCYHNVEIEDSASYSAIRGNNAVGSLVGGIEGYYYYEWNFGDGDAGICEISDGELLLNNCSAIANNNFIGGYYKTIEYDIAYTDPSTGDYIENRQFNKELDTAFDLSVYEANITAVQLKSVSTNLQVGIDSDSSCQIVFDTNFKFDISGFGDIQSVDTFNAIVEFEKLLSEKATMLGAVQNRLESALESIEVNINNLASSRSTIQDADIAKESASYIQQQILQQAAATLMSTANQSPAIALQLI